jgi:tRNA(Ile)-lysidine synthase
MLDKIVNILQNECKIRTHDLLVVGVSGGPDSVCLLHILHQIGYSIFAVHVNHGLRPEAGDEAQEVEKFSARLGVKFFSHQVDVLKFASENAVSIEEAARALRYRSLFEQAKLLNANAVLVGHNADDQVETILMHLLRGSGLVGLRGIEFRTLPNPWSESIPLLRPLLSTFRVDIQNYVDTNKLKPVTDQSNLEITYFRNRVRRELIPILESYNPKIREILLRMGQNLKDDYSILQQIVCKAWESTLIEQGDGFVSFHTANFLDFPVSIQRYLLRMAIARHLPGLRDVGFDCIERGLALLAGGKPSSQTDLIAGIRLIKDGKQFWVITRTANLPGVGS